MIISHLLVLVALGWTGRVQALTSRAASKAQVALEAIVVNNLNDVRGNLHLPVDADGLAISWTSSNPSVISADGTVTRQSTAMIVNLTASVDGIEHILTASVREICARPNFEGYAFAYFTHSTEEGENIFFAASEGNNALRWNELNGGQAVLTSKFGTGGLRDPFIIRSFEGDTFYLLATDLSIGSGTSWGDATKNGSRYLEIWESHDLVNWSEQRHVLVSPPTAGMTWAPEAFYDTKLGSYVVFWASSLYNETDTDHTGETYIRVMHCTTRDFVTFSKPTVWQDAGLSRIDSDVLQEGKTYYRFTKDEGSKGTGCSDIIMEKSSNLGAPVEGWTLVASCIGRDAGTKAVEGPTAFRANKGDVNGDKFYLFVDEYGDRGYIPLETKDISKPNWTVSKSYTLPTSPRHGTVLPVTGRELDALLEASEKATNGNSSVSASTPPSNTSMTNKLTSKSPQVSDARVGSTVLSGLVAFTSSIVFLLILF